MPPAILQKTALDSTEASLLEQPPIVTIKTERLRLETVTMDALEAIMPIITNPEVMQWTSRPPVASLAEGAHWLSARCLGRDVFNFAIRLQASNQTIGLIGSFHWPAVGYLLDPAHAGRGYATEALRAFVPAYFARVPAAAAKRDGVVGFDVLEGFTDAQNLASQRVLEKCGFTRGEVLVGDVENAMGVRDTVAFRIARPGMTLEGLGFGGEGGKAVVGESPPPEPPVQ